MEKKKLSLMYRTLRFLGFDYSEEEYGQVTLGQVVGKFFHNIRMKHLQKKMDWAILEPFLPRKMRANIMRKMGCHVGQNVFIGDFVKVDLSYPEKIFIDDYAHITTDCLLLCHQRDLRNYRVGDNAADCGYRLGEIHIGKGVMIGMGSIIMPGVTIGDGAIVGAGSVVTRDIPPYTIATGSPAKVVKQIPERETRE